MVVISEAEFAQARWRRGWEARSRTPIATADYFKEARPTGTSEFSQHHHDKSQIK